MNAAFVSHVQTSLTATNDEVCLWCKFTQGLQLVAWSSYADFSTAYVHHTVSAEG